MPGFCTVSTVSYNLGPLDNHHTHIGNTFAFRQQSWYCSDVG